MRLPELILATLLASCGGGDGPTAKFQLDFLGVRDDCFGGNQFEVQFEGSMGTMSVARTECVQGDGALFSEELPLDTYILTALIKNANGMEVCRTSPRTTSLEVEGEIVELDIMSWMTSCFGLP